MFPLKEQGISQRMPKPAALSSPTFQSLSALSYEERVQQPMCECMCAHAQG